MDKDLPRSVSDIPQKYLYDHPKVWSILGEKKRVTGTLQLLDGHSDIKFKCKREDVDKFQRVRFKSITAKGSTSSRALALDCTCWESSFTSIFKQSEAEMRFNPNMLVIQGDSSPIKQEITYIQGYLPGIAQWFDRDFLEFDRNEYKFKEPKTIYHEISLGSHAKITLNARLTVDIEKPILQGEFSAYTESFVRIDFTKPTSFAAGVRMFNHVENFFNFIFSTPHSTHILTSSNRKRGKRNIPLYIVTSKTHKGKGRDDKKNASSMLFSWEDVSNRNDVFISWALNYDSFREIIDTLLLLRSTDISEEMRFTTIINALEAVHRRYLDRKQTSDEDFKNRVESILALIANEEDKKLVEKSLKHKNEMSLRQRLKDISNIASSVGIDKPSKSMTNKILETRNYLTHGDESKKDKTLNYPDLYFANSLLGKYLKIVLLTRIGVKPEDLKKIVKESAHFKYNFRDEPPQQNKYFL